MEKSVQGLQVINSLRPIFFLLVSFQMMRTQSADRKRQCYVCNFSVRARRTLESEEIVKSLAGKNFFVYVIIRTNATVLISHEN